MYTFEGGVAQEVLVRGLFRNKMAAPGDKRQVLNLFTPISKNVRSKIRHKNNL